jgi:hypothetical protein
VDVNRRVDGSLHVRAVEIDFRAGGQVREAAGKAERVIQERAGRGYLVDVPTLRRG